MKSVPLAGGCSHGDSASCGGRCQLKEQIGFPSVRQDLELLAESQLPIRGEMLDMRVFGKRSKGHDYEDVVALVHQSPDYGVPVVRLHSVCLTGDVFGSQKCDCGPQLQSALDQILRAPYGILLYMLGHEGRGIGLAGKVRAYHLQDQGHNTITANLALGFPVDARDYSSAAEVLAGMGVKEIDVLTNNPDKIQALSDHGISVRKRIPLNGYVNIHNAEYLRIKDTRLGHLGASERVGG